METNPQPNSPRLSRRTTLRAAAIGAASVWVAPAVQMLAVAPAVAASAGTNTDPKKDKHPKDKHPNKKQSKPGSPKVKG